LHTLRCRPWAQIEPPPQTSTLHTLRTRPWAQIEAPPNKIVNVLSQYIQRYNRGPSHPVRSMASLLRARMLALRLCAVGVGASPTLTVLSAGPPSVMATSLPAAVFTEVPPLLWVLPAALSTAGCPPLPAGALAVVLPTAYAAFCVANVTALPLGPSAGALGFDVETCTVPFSGESQRDWPPSAVPPHTEWFRDYHGPMSANLLPSGPPPEASGPALFFALHGENKNDLWWGNGELYETTINADVPASTCYSGYENSTGQFVECLSAYNALVSGALLPFSSDTCFGLGLPGNKSLLDLGPLVWPVDGYLNSSGGKASYGVRQPSALVGWDGSLFLFWIDNCFDTADVWIARSAPTAGGVQQGLPGSFFSFNHTSVAWDVPTLPPAFDALTFPLFLQQAAPAGGSGSGASPAFPLSPTGCGSVRFSAARLRVAGAASGLYLSLYSVVNYTQCWNGSAVPEVVTSEPIGTRTARGIITSRSGAARASSHAPCVPVWHLFLRLTEDFVSFTDPTPLPEYDAPGFDAALLEYPSLLNSAGTDSGEVDAEDFYVLATCSSATAPCGSSYGPHVTTARLSVQVTGAGLLKRL